jgi:hypothetical protein
MVRRGLFTEAPLCHLYHRQGTGLISRESHDINDGLVLGIGLEVGATLTARPMGDRQLVLRALDLDETRLCELDALSPIEAGFGRNAALG